MIVSRQSESCESRVYECGYVGGDVDECGEDADKWWRERRRERDKKRKKEK